MAGARILSDTRDRVGESPLWDADAQALYWVDIVGRRIHRYDWTRRSQQSWDTPQRVGCIALSARGGLIAAMETGVFAVALMQPPAIAAVLLAGIVHPRPNMRFNDGRCDAQGRFWISTMCMDPAPPPAPVGAWYCLDEGGLRPAGHGNLITPNGSAFSPDGATMYYSDSHASVQTIWACDFDLAGGRIGARRVFADMADYAGRPDGAAVDAEGHYWICANDAGQLHRFSPGGRLVASLPVPVPKPSMCAFGGPRLDVLFVTSIQPPTGEVGQSGAVFALDAAVRGLPEPRFSRFPASGV